MIFSADAFSIFFRSIILLGNISDLDKTERSY
jgi:hypothetical protein